MSSLMHVHILWLRAEACFFPCLAPLLQSDGLDLDEARCVGWLEAAKLVH